MLARHVTAAMAMAARSRVPMRPTAVVTPMLPVRRSLHSVAQSAAPSAFGFRPSCAVQALRPARAVLRTSPSSFARAFHSGALCMDLTALNAVPGVTASPDVATSRFVFNHTMLRVKDAERSLDFYTRVLGFSLIEVRHFEEAKFSLYFLALVDKADIPEDDAARHEWMMSIPGVLELTHNHGTESESGQIYHNGNTDPRGFGHICVSVPDVVAACARFESLGVPFQKKLSDGRMKQLAFVKDPDQYWVEIIQPTELESVRSPSYLRGATSTASAAASSTRLTSAAALHTSPPTRSFTSLSGASRRSNTSARQPIAVLRGARMYTVSGGVPGGSPRTALMVLLAGVGIGVGGLLLLFWIGGVWLLLLIVGGLAFLFLRAGLRMRRMLMQMASTEQMRAFMSMTAPQREEFYRRMEQQQQQQYGRTAASGASGATAGPRSSVDAQAKLSALQHQLKAKSHLTLAHLLSAHPRVRRALRADSGADLKAVLTRSKLTAPSSQPTDGGLAVLVEEMLEMHHPKSHAKVMVSAAYLLRLTPGDLASLQREIDLDGLGGQAVDASFVATRFVPADFRRIAQLQSLDLIDAATRAKTDITNGGAEWINEEDEEGPVKEAEYEEISRPR